MQGEQPAEAGDAFEHSGERKPGDQIGGRAAARKKVVIFRWDE
jgi:hypothetical protein